MRETYAQQFLHVKHEHWGFDDPAGQDWSVFQRVRDEIGARIKKFAETGE